MNITYNGINSDDLGLLITKKPIIPFSNKNYETIDIKGRDGSYYVDNGLQDVVVTVEFNFLSHSTEETIEKIREIRKWISNKGDGKLYFDYNSDYFYKVKAVNINMNDYDVFEIQNFSIDFVLSPFEYNFLGANETELNTSLYNFWDVASPTYRITGNGNCILNINGNKINCTVNGTLTIDTENSKILDNESLAIGKTDISDMKQLYLIEGQNIFSWSSNFNVYITANYRTIL